MAIDAGLDAIVLQFVDFQTDCSQRSRVWVTEYGKQQAFHYCGRNAINNYVSKSGKVTVGLDLGKRSKVLISYKGVHKAELSKFENKPARVNLQRLMAGRVPGRFEILKITFRRIFTVLTTVIIACIIQFGQLK